ncbi:reverse transcriptase domain-containing protein [Tanacetum coccineum]
MTPEPKSKVNGLSKTRWISGDEGESLSSQSKSNASISKCSKLIKRNKFKVMEFKPRRTFKSISLKDMIFEKGVHKSAKNKVKLSYASRSKIILSESESNIQRINKRIVRVYDRWDKYEETLGKANAPYYPKAPYYPTFPDISDDEIQDNGKGKAKVDEEDLSKPFKEVLKCLFTRRIVEFSSPDHRMPANVKIYDGTGDPEDHVGRFVGIGNQGEWPMPVWCRMFQQTLDGKARAWFDKLSSGSIDNWGSLQEKFLNKFKMLKACDKDPTEISKIARKANETLPYFKERWVSKSNTIPNVLELMQISSFMSSHKCPELAKRFSDSIPKTMDEMLKRVDDYLRSEEAYRSTELPRGEFQRRDASVQWVQRNDRSQRFSHGNNRRRSEHKFVARMPEHHIPYVAPQRPNEEFRRPKVILTLDSLSSTPQEILATEHQLHLPQPALLMGVPSKENVNRYCDYHNEKGHNTNDCFHLKRQLEIALESGKLNHLIKDVRQR